MVTDFRHCCAPIAQRWVFAFMGFLALVMAYGMRVSLSVAITVMAQQNHPVSKDDTCSSDLLGPTANSTGSRDAPYDWSENQQGIILSSFYWGYVVTQLPGAMIAEKFGGKHTLGIGLLLTAIFTLLTPLAVNKGDYVALIVLRVFMGLGEGVTLPALNAMLSHWTPPEERSRTGSFVFVGAPLGAVFATAISGLILSKADWSWVFYFFGGIGLLWYLLWMLLCYNRPQEHPFISERELKYLDEQLNQIVHENPPPVPWTRMLRSMPLWALILVQVSHDFGFYTMATDLPKYMSSVLRFSVEENGYLSSLPYIGMWLCCVVMSWIADWLIQTSRMSITNVRKLGTTIASLGPGLFIVAASYAKCDRTLVVSFFILGVTLLGSGIPSLKVNALDLSPNYSGTVMAISNGAASCSGIVAPWLVGKLVPDQSLSQWRVIFWLIFIILMVTNAFYLVFASGEVADWNDPVLLKRLKEEKKQAREERRQV